MASDGSETGGHSLPDDVWQDIVEAVARRKERNAGRRSVSRLFEKVDIGGGNYRSYFDSACLYLRVAGSAKDMLRYILLHPEEKFSADFFLRNRECFGQFAYLDSAICAAFRVLCLRTKAPYRASFTIYYDAKEGLLWGEILGKVVEHNMSRVPKERLAQGQGYMVTRLTRQFHEKHRAALANADTEALPPGDLDGDDFWG